MLLIDPRLEHISRRIGKLDKRVLRCFEMKTTAKDQRRLELDKEIQELRAERAELLEIRGQIPRHEASDRLLRSIQAGAPGGSAETSAARRLLTQGGC